MKAKFLMVLAVCAPLYGGFVGGVCYDNPNICVSTDLVTSSISGSTTYGFTGQFTGALVGNKPTLGTYASMTVSDPNGVPTLGSGIPVSAFSAFTDVVTVSSAPVYAFNMNMHVVNSTNNVASGFYDVSSMLVLTVKGRDSLNNLLWSTSNYTVTMITPGATTQPITYTTPFGFPSANIATLELTMILSSSVWYGLGSSSTAVSAFSDASHTLSLESIEAQDGFGGSLPGTFVSSVGADYSAAAVPEPASGIVILLALAVLAQRRRATRR